MQRLFNLEKWTYVEEGQSFTLQSSSPDKLRKVVLEVNAPDRVLLHVRADQDHARFLASVIGRETIEFHGRGNIELYAIGGDVGIYTADGEDISIQVEAPQIFTRIVERRRRSPELESIMASMNANLERRLAQQSRELERLFVNRERARAAQLAPPGGAGGPRAQQPQNGGPGSSGPPATGTSGGTDG